MTLIFTGPGTEWQIALLPVKPAVKRLCHTIAASDPAFAAAAETTADATTAAAVSPFAA